MRDLTDTSTVRDPDEEPPPFADWDDPDRLLDGESIRERMVDVILQLRDPTKVATVADRADCDTETARDYLEWFADLGMVREHSGRPVRYSRNDSYLWWRRVERIRETYSEEEIVDELAETVDAIDEYHERFDAASPDEVSLVEPGGETSVEDLWEAVSTWKTLERRAALLDAARRRRPPARRTVESIDV